MKDWEREYKSLRGHMNRFMGEVGEMYAQMVMNAFDGRTVDGEVHFNHPDPVTLPMFEQIERRGGIVEAGVPIEIDLTGEWTLPDGDGQGAWLIQVRYTQAPTREEAVQKFLTQTDAVIAKQNYTTVTRWYFCKGGYTAKAAQALQQAGVLYSDRAGFNALANLFDFFGLPK